MSVEQIRHRFIAYLDSTFAPSGRRSRVLVGAALAGLGVFILLTSALLNMWQAAGVGVILLAVGGYRLYLALSPVRVYRRIRGVVERGALVTAYVVQANQHLLVPGSLNLPALVLFSFDARGDDANFMSAVVARVQKLKGTTPSEPELRALAERITSEKAEIYHRVKLPVGLTDGVPVYMGDLIVRPTRLRNKYIDRRALVCLAETGDKGGIELVPDWIQDETRAGMEPETPNRRRSSLLSHG